MLSPKPSSTQPSDRPAETATTSSSNVSFLNPQALVMGFSLLLLWVSIAHSLEDFVYGIPARFGLSVATAALLLGAGYVVVQGTGILLSARGRRAGYMLTLATGAAWALAAVLDHLGEVLTTWPYREGIISKALEVGIMLTGAVLALVSLWALLSSPSHRHAH